MQNLLNDKRFHYFFLVYLGLLSFLGRVPWTGIRPDADAWYAQKAKEFLNSDHWFTMTYNGVPVFEHTPFMIWMDALSFKIWGVSTFGAVFPSGVFAVLTLVFTYKLALRMFDDRWVAFLSALILLFPGYYLENARRGHVDATLGFWVVLALYAFWRGRDEPRWYYLYGISTGCAVLTKSFMGLFPYIIGLAFLLSTRQFRRIFHPHLVLGVTLGTVWGGSWYWANYVNFGNEFVDFHFGTILFGIYGAKEKDWTRYFFFAKEIFKYYWPWIPILIGGFWLFGKRVVREKDHCSLFILIWFATIYLVMSGSSTHHQMQYMISLFPAMALIVAKTLSDWLQETWRFRLTGAMVTVILATGILLGATGFETRKASSLRQKSVETRDLADVINLNTPAGESLGNYRLPAIEEPQTGIFFYGDRFLEKPLVDEHELMQQVRAVPEKTWLANIYEFKKLEESFPDELYLIQGNRKYAYFTSMKSRDRIRYDFSQEGLTFHR